MRRNLAPIPFPTKDITWQFMKVIPKHKRRHAGQATQAKSALKRLEEAMRVTKEAKRTKTKI